MYQNVGIFLGQQYLLFESNLIASHRLNSRLLLDLLAATSGLAPPLRYCVSKKSCPFFYDEYTMKIGQGFLDILYYKDSTLTIII